MKKRLRKKHGRGEFTDYGVWVLMRLADGVTDDRREELSEEFLDNLVEYGMRGSIGCRPDFKALVFMNWRRSVVTHWMLDFLTEWMGKHPEIVGHEFSDPVDARRGAWPAPWPVFEYDELVRVLAHGVAWNTFHWHRRHPGNSVFDAIREEGLNPLAYDVRTTERPPLPSE